MKKMFAKAKRFIYPKPEEPSPTCERCHKHQSSFNRGNYSTSSSRSLKIENRAKSPNCSTNKSKSLNRDSFKKTSTPKPEKKSPPKMIEKETEIVTTVMTEIHEKPVSPSKKIEKKAKIVPTMDEIHEKSASPSKKIEREAELVTTVAEIHEKSAPQKQLYIETSQGDDFSSNPSSMQSTPSSSKEFDNLNEYLQSLQEKIEHQRRKIEVLRQQLNTPTPSVDEGFHSGTSRSTSPEEAITPFFKAHFEERISHIERISQLCVRETLDFVTKFNKCQEMEGMLRPKDNQHLVEFCTELLIEINKKIDKSNKWKIFIKWAMRPLRRLIRPARKDNS